MQCALSNMKILIATGTMNRKTAYTLLVTLAISSMGLCRGLRILLRRRTLRNINCNLCLLPQEYSLQYSALIRT